MNRINDTEAHFEMERASRYGWQAGATFYRQAPARKTAKPGILARVLALFA